MNYVNVILVIFVISSLLAAPRMVRAYLDPGTGSFIFQIVIASVLAIALSFKKVWVFFINLKNKIFASNKNSEELKD